MPRSHPQESLPSSLVQCLGRKDRPSPSVRAPVPVNHQPVCPLPTRRMNPQGIGTAGTKLDT